MSDRKSQGMRLMIRMSELSKAMTDLAAEAEQGASGASELEKHQIRRQASIASESADRARYWIGQAYRVSMDEQ